MNPDRKTANRWSVLTAAPHRLAFLCGFASLLLASAWWACHLLARYGLAPAAALDMQLAPIWAHSFLMLFTVFPTFFLGFLYHDLSAVDERTARVAARVRRHAAAADRRDVGVAGRRARVVSPGNSPPWRLRWPASSWRWSPCCAC